MSTIVTRSGKGAALTHTEVDANFTNLNADKAEASAVIPAIEKGAASGVCPLDATSKILATYLPSYVDDVLEYANLAALPVTGETGKIYVALDTNKTYRWSGSAYVYITSGAVDSVAGKTGVVTLVKADVGLGNVDNTTDALKPISTATQTALDLKAPISSPTFTGTVSGITKAMVSLGNVDNTTDAGKPVSTATQTALDLKSPLASPTFTGTVSGVTKAMVGLGNVDNTTDASKPVSTAAAAALLAAVPAQTGNSGKYLSTNGTATSWTTVDALPSQTGNSGKYLTTSGTSASWETLASVPKGMFTKGSSTIVSFVTTGAFAVSTQTQLYLEVNGLILAIASGTVVAMPSAVTGTDYAIWAETAGTLTCTNNHTTPPTANARKIGGFHYAPGGNAAAQSGGNTTPYINQYSFWDLKFKPACQDPRGMTLVAGNFWADIYLLNTDPDVNGTSKYNVTIADGSSPPKVPTKFGGNGTTAYTTLTWWEANEVLAANGKRSASYQEYAALAFGTTEASSLGTDPGSTILNAAYTSRWGVMQATGVMWVWGKDFGGGAAAAGWVANTTGRGQTYQLPNAVLFSGDWLTGAFAGSRCSSWGNSPSTSGYYIGGRGVVDHLLLD